MKLKVIATAALSKVRQWRTKMVLFREKFGANGEAFSQLSSAFSFFPRAGNFVCCAAPPEFDRDSSITVI